MVQCQCTPGERWTHRDVLDIALLVRLVTQLAQLDFSWGMCSIGVAPINDAPGRAVGSRALLNTLRGLCYMLRL